MYVCERVYIRMKEKEKLCSVERAINKHASRKYLQIFEYLREARKWKCPTNKMKRREPIRI